MNIGPFGWRAARFIARPPEEDAKVNILTGSIRSSKTWALNAKLLKMLSKGFWPGGIGLIAGNSQKSIKTNMLTDLLDWAGPRRARYSVGNGELYLFGRPFIIVGASDQHAYKRIKGSTVGIGIIDEATLVPESFWDMAVSRLSLPLSRLYATTNPDNPYHYLKKKWLDDMEKCFNHDMWFDTFILDDNPNIEDKEKDRLKRSYTGVFHQRNILGKWVIAEGAIYKDVVGPDTYYTDATRPIALLSQHGHVDRFVSIDVGTVHAMAMLEFLDDGKVLWVDKEFYWSSPFEQKQKTNGEYVQDFLQTFCVGLNPMGWPIAIVDPSAASFKAELNKAGVVVMNAENEVLEGIRKVSSMLAKRSLRINQDRCPNLKRELETYAWDDKAAKNGTGEKPVKMNDDACFVAGTMVRTPEGERPIEELRVGGKVVTTLGEAYVTGNSARAHQKTVQWNGTYVTPNHKILTQRGPISVLALLPDDRLFKWRQSYMNKPNYVGYGALDNIRAEAAYFGTYRKVLLPSKEVRTVTVYNLSTEHGCYFANDVLVSNCDSLRYGVATKMPDWRVAG